LRAIDTNIIIRFLVKDDPKQCVAVKKLFETVEENGDKLWVPFCVILEMIWVLRSRYHASKEDILLAIQTLLDMKIFEFQEQELLEEFHLHAGKAAVDLDDLLIGLIAAEKCDFTWTFDKKASKSGLFQLLK